MLSNECVTIERNPNKIQLFINNLVAILEK
jgi:hypothetical protein